MRWIFLEVHDRANQWPAEAAPHPRLVSRLSLSNYRSGISPPPKICSVAPPCHPLRPTPPKIPSSSRRARPLPCPHKGYAYGLGHTHLGLLSRPCRARARTRTRVASTHLNSHRAARTCGGARSSPRGRWLVADVFHRAGGRGQAERSVRRRCTVQKVYLCRPWSVVLDMDMAMKTLPFSAALIEQSRKTRQCVEFCEERQRKRSLSLGL